MHLLDTLYGNVQQKEIREDETYIRIRNESIMKTHDSSTKHLSFIVIFSLVMGLVLAGSLPTEAATVAASATPPPVDGEDIAQLVADHVPGGNEGHVWANRPIHGQSFTTGSSGSYLLSAVTLKNLSTVGNPGGWTIYVGTISGSVLTPIRQESSGNVNIVGNDYITWTFDTPIELDPNTLYGFDVDVASGGFISDGNGDENSYTGGHPFSNGANGTPDHNSLSFHTNFERVFHLDMAASGEPATLFYIEGGLMMLGMALLGYHLARRLRG